MFLMAPLEGDFHVDHPKGLGGLHHSQAPAGVFLFRGRGSQGAGRVTGGNVIWIPGMYLETRKSRANICFSFDALLE